MDDAPTTKQARAGPETPDFDQSISPRRSVPSSGPAPDVNSAAAPPTSCLDKAIVVPIRDGPTRLALLSLSPCLNERVVSRQSSKGRATKQESSADARGGRSTAKKFILASTAFPHPMSDRNGPHHAHANTKILARSIRFLPPAET